MPSLILRVLVQLSMLLAAVCQVNAPLDSLSLDMPKHVDGVVGQINAILILCVLAQRSFLQVEVGTMT